MVRLLRNLLDLAVEFEEPTTTELSPPSGDRIQVFAPVTHISTSSAADERPRWRCSRWREIRTAQLYSVAAGIEIVGAIERDSNWEWLHFRADGILYELASRRANAGCSSVQVIHHRLALA